MLYNDFTNQELAFEVARQRFINTNNGWALHQLFCYYETASEESILSFMDKELLGIKNKNKKLLLV